MNKEEKEELDRIAIANVELYCDKKDVSFLLNLIERQQRQIEKYKWKPISDYSRKDYDWVLVKYFDECYECVPVVAEQRVNGKWVTRDEKEILFDVKYFFDMQQLDKEEENE